MTQLQLLFLALWITRVIGTPPTPPAYFPTSSTFTWFSTRLRKNKDPLIDPRDKDHYHANYNYEPYWPQGGWKISDHNLDRIEMVCGEECGMIPMRIKHVCGHKSNEHWLESCSWPQCYGEITKDITVRYKTFDTYCQFLAEQCRHPTDRWALLYIGECNTKQESYFKHVINGDQIVPRVEGYLAEYNKTLEKLHTTRGPRFTTGSGGSMPDLLSSPDPAAG